MGDIFEALRTLSQEDESKLKGHMAKARAWVTGDNVNYMASPGETKKLEPGYYENYATPSGLVFHRTDMKLDEVIPFEDSPAYNILRDIQQFWSLEERFKRHGLSFKRGIILSGPAGSGKSSIVQMVVNDVIQKGGIGIKYEISSIFRPAIVQLREVQPNVPVVVVMEDIDAIITNDHKSKLLNILDGVEGVDKVVFIATTNYPEILESRIISRPSRFDVRVTVPHPGEKTRRAYLKHLQKPEPLPDGLGDAMIRDSDGFSFAHLKEFYISVSVLQKDYEETRKRLTDMVKKRMMPVETGPAEGGRRMGFGEGD